MSYILDALKKSERQRQKGVVPGVLTVQDTAVPEARGRMVWPYVAVAVLLLNAGLFAWLLAPSRTKNPPAAVQQAIHERANTIGDVSPKISVSGKKVNHEGEHAAVKAVKAVRADIKGPAPVSREAPSEGTSMKVPAEPVSQKDAPVPPPAQVSPAQPAASETKPVEAKIPSPENKIYNVMELPTPIQQGLPAFAISAHIYSNDPASRMVKINGQMMREGQDLAAGLKLDEITPNGVIFSYQNYRFRVGLK